MENNENNNTNTTDNPSAEPNNNNNNVSQNNTPASASKTEPLAIAAMVLGIVGVVLCWNWAGIACAIIGLVLGISGKNKIDRSEGTLSGRGMAKAGIILSIIGLGLFIVALAACGLVLSGVLGSF